MIDSLRRYYSPPALLAALLLSGGAARADATIRRRCSTAASASPSAPPGDCSTDGEAGKTWVPVGDKEAVASDDLLISLPGGEIESRDGGVHLELLKLFNSPLPVMEPAVTLHQAKDADLDFTWNAEWSSSGILSRREAPRPDSRPRPDVEAALEEPGARMLVEFYSAWPKGARFKKTPGPADVPLARMTFLVLKGQVDLKHAGAQAAMTPRRGRPSSSGTASPAWTTARKR